MIFETSVLMHFGYALKIPDQFISKMVFFTVLMWNGPNLDFERFIANLLSDFEDPFMKFYFIMRKEYVSIISEENKI